MQSTIHKKWIDTIGAVAYWFRMSKDESKSKITKLPTEIAHIFNRISANPLNKNAADMIQL